MPDAANLDIADEFTLEAWINPGSQDPTANGIISKVGDGGSPAIDREFQFGTQNNDQELFCQFNGPTEPWPTNALSVTLASAIPVEQWTHVACTYNNSELRLYRDGTLAGGGFVGPKTIANSASNLRISLDNNSNVPSDGIIDEAKVYNVALPVVAIQEAATCNYWKDPVSGIWTDGTKWTAGVPPGASDLTCITATRSTVHRHPERQYYSCRPHPGLARRFLLCVGSRPHLKRSVDYQRRGCDVAQLELNRHGRNHEQLHEHYDLPGLFVY